MKRSVRRHHYARLKQKWENISRREYSYTSTSRLNDEKWRQTIAARLTTTHTNCSCWMCANCRKADGITLQEKCNVISYYEQIDGL